MAPQEEIGRIHQLARSGKVSEAFVAASALAGQHTDTVDAARLAMDLGLRVHGPQGPDGIAEALGRDHAGSLAADYAACYAHVCAGRLDAARTASEALVARFPDEIDPGLLLAEIHHRQADIGQAIACLEGLLARHPKSARCHATLANLYLHDGQVEKAAEHAATARTLGLTAPANVLVLGHALCDLDRHAEAVRVLEEADAAQPGNFNTLTLLSVARLGAGSAQGALAAAGRALEIRPFSVRGPEKGKSAGLTVAVLEDFGPSFFNRQSPLNYSGLNYPSYVASPDMRVLHVPLSPRAPDHLEKAGVRPDIFVNNLVVSESVSAPTRDLYDEFVALYEADDIPVINGLDAVLACGREKNAQKFASESAFIFPRLTHLRPATSTAESIIAEIEADFEWPVLIRHPQTNLGMGMRLFDGPDALREALVDMSLPEYFVTQYHECRDEQGVGRHYRAVIIGDEAFVDRANSHVDFSSHDHLRRTPQWLESGFDKVEQEFLADPDEFLGFDWKKVFAPIIENTPLDVYGIDFGVTREGRPVVFEVNAAMNLFSAHNAEISPYLAEHYQFLNDRTVRLMRARAGKAA